MTISHNLEDTEKLAAEIATQIKDGGILYLYGDLGSGKTTFTKFLGKHLGFPHSEVKSPTYTYIQKYTHAAGEIYHIDLYRLDSVDELLMQEIEEITHDSRKVVVIEWADRLPYKLGEEGIEIYFEYVDKSSRKITVK